MTDYIQYPSNPLAVGEPFDEDNDHIREIKPNLKFEKLEDDSP